MSISGLKPFDILIFDWDGTAVLEGTAVPVMLLPDLGGTSYRRPESLLIPLGSDSRTSDALRFGLRIAARSRTPVDLV